MQWHEPARRRLPSRHPSPIPELTVFELPSWKPLFDQLILDDEGGIWLRRFPDSSLGYFDEYNRDPDEAPSVPARWTVLDPAGRWLGEVELPQGLELHALARGRAYGVVKDELGVQTVRVHRILRR